MGVTVEKPLLRSLTFPAAGLDLPLSAGSPRSISGLGRMRPGLRETRGIRGVESAASGIAGAVDARVADMFLLLRDYVFRDPREHSGRSSIER